ncbi:hypothetical protein [Halorhodospira neutriphila]|uniref:Uncharacterized protein n=1 Tax=Halorhodospira neutriphila TaxID=168379 RepID=A0ABS1E2J0_9GAMM|nr:hypothetical protein [Halorhodospira neutriphila]MBK1725693.1 hypothetical protein [Halorhodospira neutriphila]
METRTQTVVDFAAEAARRGQQLVPDGRGGITARQMDGGPRSREYTAVVNLHRRLRREGVPGWLCAYAEAAARQAVRDGADSYDAIAAGVGVISDGGPSAA